MNKYIIEAEEAGRTLFKYIIKKLHDVPRSRIEKLFRSKEIKVNGKSTKDKSVILQAGDEVSIYGIYTNQQKSTRIVSDIKFNVIFEDNNILVISKPANIAVHSEYNCIDTQVKSYLKWIPINTFEPSHVGRLDKVTTGIMVYAKNFKTLKELNEKQGNFHKIYEFKSDLPNEIETRYHILHDENYKRMKAMDDSKYGRQSHTRFFFDANKKMAQIYTGRKHQIRASLSKLGYPIYGDVKYGGKKDRRVFLHSTEITFKGLEGDLEYLNNQKFYDVAKWR